MEQKKFDGVNSRRFYRVEYPDNDRPTVDIGGARYEILNSSEKSIKFLCEVPGRFELEEEVKGVITFHDGEKIAVKGTVYRIYDDGVVVCFERGLQFSRIIKEQWFLMSKFKHLLE